MSKKSSVSRNAPDRRAAKSSASNQILSAAPTIPAEEYDTTIASAAVGEEMKAAAEQEQATTQEYAPDVPQDDRNFFEKAKDGFTDFVADNPILSTAVPVAGGAITGGLMGFFGGAGVGAIPGAIGGALTALKVTGAAHAVAAVGDMIDKPEEWDAPVTKLVTGYRDYLKHGYNIATDAEGNPLTDENGAPIFADSNGELHTTEDMENAYGPIDVSENGDIEKQGVVPNAVQSLMGLAGDALTDVADMAGDGIIGFLKELGVPAEIIDLVSKHGKTIAIAGGGLLVANMLFGGIGNIFSGLTGGLIGGQGQGGGGGFNLFNLILPGALLAGGFFIADHISAQKAAGDATSPSSNQQGSAENQETMLDDAAANAASDMASNAADMAANASESIKDKVKKKLVKKQAQAEAA